MRDLFDIISSGGSHPVRMSEDLLRSIVEEIAPSIVIADRFFSQDLADLAVPLVLVEAEEGQKDLSRIPALIEACRRAGLTRSGSILAIGGGIIQDIACFIASVYMRGTRWIYIPTTLLGMVDSCIGGKSSINVGDFKNLVGTFYPPEAIIVPPAVLATLASEHIAAGRAEAAKICFARGGSVFDSYLSLDKGPALGRSADIIALSLGAKKWFIEIDEFDRNERLLLNFGHSFGHALESCSAFSVPHGVAVGVGCLAAIEMSRSIHPRLSDDARVGRLESQMIEILGQLEFLPIALADVSEESFFRYFDSDKKHSAALYNLILIDQDAQLERRPLPRDADTQQRVWAAVDRTRALIKIAIRSNSEKDAVSA